MSVTLSSMVSPDEPSASREYGNDVDVRAEALDVVFDALHWRLADARWQTIEQVLIAMDAALAAGDLDALAAASADLELAGPLRITRIGATPVVPPAPPVRDLLNRLVYSLGGIPAAPQHEPEDAGADDDGTSRR
jgi:hypothetical protein